MFNKSCHKKAPAGSKCQRGLYIFSISFLNGYLILYYSQNWKLFFRDIYKLEFNDSNDINNN